jgi:hypothetical protein
LSLIDDGSHGFYGVMPTEPPPLSYRHAR